MADETVKNEQPVEPDTFDDFDPEVDESKADYDAEETNKKEATA